MSGGQESGLRSANGGPKCPICGKPQVARFRPFCSARCADIDLHRWMGEVYRVPTTEAPDEKDAEATDTGGERDENAGNS